MFHRTVLNISAGLIGSAVLFAAGAASAHARLVKSDPPANATVAAPKAITLTFSEKLTPAFSKFELGIADGMKVNVKTAVSEDRRSIMGTPTAKLMAGAYKITWHAAAADDGHKTEGTLGFTVR